MKAYSLVTSSAVAVALLTTWIASAQAGGLTVPAEWVGVWDLQVTTRDCTSGAIQTTSTPTDTLCVQDIFHDSDPDFTCEGEADATSFSYTCTGSSEISPGCNVTYTVVASGTRTDDSYMATATRTTDFDPGCEIPDMCAEVTTIGSRIDSNPDVCQASPVVVSTWGHVKTHYQD